MGARSIDEVDDDENGDLAALRRATATKDRYSMSQW